MRIVGKVLGLFSKAEKRKLLFLLSLMIVSALFEVVGVASIMPFMALLADPKVAETSRVFIAISNFLQTKDTLELQQAAGLLTLGFLVASNGSALLNNAFLLRFTHGYGHKMAVRLLHTYMGRPYAFFLARNSSELGKNVLAEVQRVAMAILVPMLQLTARLCVVVFLVGLLIAINPILAISSALVIGVVYAAIYLAIRRRLSRHGRSATQAGEDRFRAVTDALSGIKEIKISGREASFEKKFEDASLIQSHHLAIAESFSLLPKYVLEIIAFGGIVVLSLVLLHTYQDPSKVLPIIALYAFAGYRLMPAMQQIYSSLTIIRYHASALDILDQDMIKEAESLAPAPLPPPPSFKQAFKLDRLSFAYEGGEEVLRDLSLEIRPNTTVGFAGASGAGKTTLIDIMLGLLAPTSGSLRVDGQKIEGDLIRPWQSILGYVPQQIYLSDDSIAANIAFGVPEAERDQTKIERAARLAHLHDFIQTMPLGYETSVGDRGVRLSGGQRQRIGIARALYNDPAILIMDEATSALDNLTESAVMEAIAELSGKKTIILIAHRLTTLKPCEVIHFMDKGGIAASGRYDELMEKSAAFRKLALAERNKDE